MVSVIMLSVTFHLLLWWMSFCWVSLCWMSWRPPSAAGNSCVSRHYKHICFKYCTKAKSIQKLFMEFPSTLTMVGKFFKGFLKFILTQNLQVKKIPLWPFSCIFLRYLVEKKQMFCHSFWHHLYCWNLPEIMQSKQSIHIRCLWLMQALAESGNTNWKGMLCTVDLLIKVACFVT